MVKYSRCVLAVLLLVFFLIVSACYLLNGTMPCWFYDKKELLNTPSARDGISADVEAWYRKEGAKHIIDAGNKLGLYLFHVFCLD